MIALFAVFFYYIRLMKDLNRLKEVLVSKKVKQSELASALGKNVNTVSKRSTNKRQPSVEDLDKIAIFLKVDISELLKPTEF